MLLRVSGAGGDFPDTEKAGLFRCRLGYGDIILSAIMLLGIVRETKLLASRCTPPGAEVVRKQRLFICGSAGCLGWLIFRD